MKNILITLTILLLWSCGQPAEAPETETAETSTPTEESPWSPLFGDNLSAAMYNDSIWQLDGEVLSASSDQVIWTTSTYDNFELELEFKNATGLNSGVIFYCTDRDNWIPNSLEVQIADDYAKEWAESPGYARSAGIYGHRPASVADVVKPAGEWNHLRIVAMDTIIKVSLNDVDVNTFNMKEYTSGTENPDGVPVPAWLPNPPAEMATQGYIGLQGKHGDAEVEFRNLMIQEL